MPGHALTVHVVRLLNSGINTDMKCLVMYWRSVWPISTKSTRNGYELHCICAALIDHLADITYVYRLTCVHSVLPLL